jgi:hypothetical protein
MGNKSYSKGISWFDDCRIPFVDGGWGTRHNKEYPEWKGAKNFTHPEQILSQDTRGRFPANLLVCDDMLNDGNIIQYNKNRTDNGTYLGGHRKEYVGTDDNDVVKQIKGQFFNDKGTNSRYYNIDKWFDNIISE